MMFPYFSFENILPGSTIDVEFDVNGAGAQTIPNTINADYAVSEGDGHIFVRVNILDSERKRRETPEEFRKYRPV